MRILSQYYNLNNLNDLSYNFEYITKNKYLFFKLNENYENYLFNKNHNIIYDLKFKYKIFSIVKREPEYSLNYHVLKEFTFGSIKENLNIDFLNIRDKVVYWDEYDKVLSNLNNYFNYKDYSPVFNEKDFKILFFESLFYLINSSFNLPNYFEISNIISELKTNKYSEEYLSENLLNNVVFSNVYDNFKKIYDMYLSNYFYDYLNFYNKFNERMDKNG